MNVRVPRAMAQFVLKIEKLSHIMGPTPILEMACAYGLRPRLWLLIYTTLETYNFYVPLHRKELPASFRSESSPVCHKYCRRRAGMN